MRGGLLEDDDALVLGGDRRQPARDPPPGRAPPGVHYAPARVAALESERESALAVGVEVDPDRFEVVDARGRLFAKRAYCARSRGAAAGGERIGGVELGRVVGRERGGDPALGPVARRGGERRARYERHARAAACGAQGGVEAGGARPDHGHIDLEGTVRGLRVSRGSAGGHGGEGTVPAWGRRSSSAIRPPSSTRRGRTPRGRGASRQSRPSSRGGDGTGGGGARRPQSSATSCAPSIPSRRSPPYAR